MTNASGTRTKRRVRTRISVLQHNIFTALNKRAPRRSKRWLMLRRALLRGALDQDGFRLRDFAKKMDVTHTHLNYVLRGERKSSRIDQAAAVLITFVYGERIGSRYEKTEPRDVLRWQGEQAERVERTERAAS